MSDIHVERPIIGLIVNSSPRQVFMVKPDIDDLDTKIPDDAYLVGAIEEEFRHPHHIFNILDYEEHLKYRIWDSPVTIIYGEERVK